MQPFYKDKKLKAEKTKFFKNEVGLISFIMQKSYICILSKNMVE